LTLSLLSYSQDKNSYILLFGSETFEVMNTLESKLSEPWEISIDTMIYPEGLDLPVISMSCYNHKTEDDEGNTGVSIILIDKSYEKRVREFFKNEMTFFYTTKSFIIITSHGHSVPFEKFAKEKSNQKFFKSFHKLNNEFEKFLSDNNKRL